MLGGGLEPSFLAEIRNAAIGLVWVLLDTCVETELTSELILVNSSSFVCGVGIELRGRFGTNDIG